MASRIGTPFNVSAEEARRRLMRARDGIGYKFLANRDHAREMSGIIARGVTKRGALDATTLNAAIRAARASGGRIDSLEKRVYLNAKAVAGAKPSEAVQSIFKENDKDFQIGGGLINRIGGSLFNGIRKFATNPDAIGMSGVGLLGLALIVGSPGLALVGGLALGGGLATMYVQFLIENGKNN